MVWDWEVVEGKYTEFVRFSIGSCSLRVVSYSGLRDCCERGTFLLFSHIYLSGALNYCLLDVERSWIELHCENSWRYE